MRSPSCRARSHLLNAPLRPRPPVYSASSSYVCSAVSCAALLACAFRFPPGCLLRVLRDVHRCRWRRDGDSSRRQCGGAVERRRRCAAELAQRACVRRRQPLYRGPECAPRQTRVARWRAAAVGVDARGRRGRRGLDQRRGLECTVLFSIWRRSGCAERHRVCCRYGEPPAASCRYRRHSDVACGWVRAGFRRRQGLQGAI